MQRIDTSRAVTTRPAADTGAASPGFFSGGNPSLGQLATELSPEWCNSIQESIYRTIIAGLVSPAKGQIGDTNLLEAIKNLHRPIFDVYQAAAGFQPGFNQEYTYSLTFTPPFPCKILGLAWTNLGAESPTQTSPSLWAIETKLLINNTEIIGVNGTLTSWSLGAASVAANVLCSVTNRIRTASPSGPYPPIAPAVAYIAFPWA